VEDRHHRQAPPDHHQAGCCNALKQMIEQASNTSA
jgi:hypothetical protein